MTSLVQVLATAVSFVLLLLVLDLVRRRKLREEYSLIWIACAGALLIASIWRDLLDALAHWLGVYYPPAVLLLILILFVFVACLHFSVVVSRQRAQIERLVEDHAILAARLPAETPVDAMPATRPDAFPAHADRFGPASHDGAVAASREGDSAALPPSGPRIPRAPEMPRR
jgi:hypothetical protein